MTQPEDLLEEALRSDLPSKDTENRLRRRLLGAGLAVGNGLAASTAAASGGAAAASGSASALAKVATLSWGLKVGLAAAVAIPSVGLLWEHQNRASPTTATAASSPTTPRLAVSVVAAPVRHEPAPDAPDALPEPSRAAGPPPSRAIARREEPSPVLAVEPRVPAPSQSAFTPSEATPQGDARARTTLSEETRLLDRAFAALSAGDTGAAAQLLAEHEARYPQGLLVKERQRAKTRLSELSRGE
jgi:hypothetical protein